MKGGEGQASRMRHALPDQVIHLHTEYASLTNLQKALNGRFGLRV